MTLSKGIPIQWRATGPYSPVNASKAGLTYETRKFFETYAQLGDIAATRRMLVNGTLPQRSRETRQTIVTIIQQRLIRWSPPRWVYEDLVMFAHANDQPLFQAALLLHVVRQDALLYDFVQHVAVPRWQHGDHVLIRADVQHFLDHMQLHHPEIERWSHATREKLAGNVLSILRDYGLLRGREQKQIVEPLVPLPVADHLVRLLLAEGVAPESVADHSDWQIWLWKPQQVRTMLHTVEVREATA